MSVIGVGLIGYGLGGRVFHAPFVAATDGMALRAVVSSRAEEVHADLPDVAVMPDIDTLLARPDISLVVVCSPDACHAAHALAAIAAGKNVLVDKPFATTLADAQAVATAADRAGLVLSVFHNRRWDADFLTLRRLIAEDRLGRIAQFESHFDRWRPEAAAIWKEARDGGSWLDLGPHLVDQALCLFGRPQAITLDLATLRDGAPAPDWFHAVLQYPRHRAVLHSSKLTCDHRLRFAVHGTAGSWIKCGIDTQESAILGGAAPTDPAFGDDPGRGHYTPVADPAGACDVANERGDYRAFWQALERTLRGAGPNPVPAADAIDVMEVLEAGLASAAQARTITIASRPDHAIRPV